MSRKQLVYYVNIAKVLHKPLGDNLASESLVENLLNQQKNIEFLVEIWKMLVSKTEYAELCLSLKQPAKRWKCRNNKQNERISLCKNKGVLMWKNLQAWLYNSITLTWRNKLLENDIRNQGFLASLFWFKHFPMSENKGFLKWKFYFLLFGPLIARYMEKKHYTC